MKNLVFNFVMICLAVTFLWACQKESSILDEIDTFETTYTKDPGNGNGNGNGNNGGPPQCNPVSFCVDATGDINGMATAVNCENEVQDRIIVGVLAGGPSNFCITFGDFIDDNDTQCAPYPSCFASQTIDNKGMKIDNLGPDGQGNILISISKYFISGDGKKYAYLADGVADLWPLADGNIMTITLTSYRIVKDGKHNKNCLVSQTSSLCDFTTIVVERGTSCAQDCENS